MGLKKDFLWGSATASYQCEGAVNEGGRVPSMWDTYLHDGGYETGDVASDFYHHYKEDIKMMAEGGQNTLRLSLAWPRIIKNIKGEINEEGVEFYRDVLKTCQQYGVRGGGGGGHWDLPQYLE